MEQGEGQHRRDARDSGSYIVFAPIRRDPEPTFSWPTVWGVLALVGIGCFLAVAILAR